MTEYTFECAIKFKMNIDEKDVEERFRTLQQYFWSKDFETFVINNYNALKPDFDVCDWFDEEEE